MNQHMYSFELREEKRFSSETLQLAQTVETSDMTEILSIVRSLSRRFNIGQRTFLAANECTHTFVTFLNRSFDQKTIKHLLRTPRSHKAVYWLHGVSTGLKNWVSFKGHTAWRPLERIDSRSKWPVVHSLASNITETIFTGLISVTDMCLRMECTLFGTTRTFRWTGNENEWSDENGRSLIDQTCNEQWVSIDRLDWNRAHRLDNNTDLYIPREIHNHILRSLRHFDCHRIQLENSLKTCPSCSSTTRRLVCRSSHQWNNYFCPPVDSSRQWPLDSFSPDCNWKRDRCCSPARSWRVDTWWNVHFSHHQCKTRHRARTRQRETNLLRKEERPSDSVTSAPRLCPTSWAKANSAINAEIRLWWLITVTSPVFNVLITRCPS